MVRQFIQQISVAAHSWNIQIIRTYLELPQLKKTLKDRIYELQGEIDLARVEEQEIEEELAGSESELKEEK